MRCKPGDIAIVINAAPKHQDCLGREVEVLRRYRNPIWADWEIRFRHTPPSMQGAAEWCANDPQLLPLRPGIPDDEDTLPAPIVEEECPF